jgi:signal peptidase II
MLTVILIGGIIYHYIREEYEKRSTLLDTGYTLILAGALSHAYERIFVGHVIDFIAVKYFAILNFADIFISIGAICIIFYYLFYAEHRSR